MADFYFLFCLVRSYLFDLEYWETLDDNNNNNRSTSYGSKISNSNQIPVLFQSTHNDLSTTQSNQESSSCLVKHTSSTTGCSQLGSMLSVSTLTSTNTLIKPMENDGCTSINTTGTMMMNEDNSDNMDSSQFGMMTGLAVSGGNTNMNICRMTHRISFVFDSLDDKIHWIWALVYHQLFKFV